LIVKRVLKLYASLLLLKNLSINRMYQKGSFLKQAWYGNPTCFFALSA
jgi:hypothetical protein